MANSLVSFAIEKLGKVLEDEVASLLGVTKELRKLSSAFTSIKAVLEDAETRHLKEQSVKDWLKKLKDVAYDIDDILDDCTTESLPSQDDEGDESLSCNKKVQNFLSPFSCFGHVAFRHKLANRIKDTWERLEEIDSEKNRFQFKIGNAERTDEIEGRETGSQVDESATVGRGGDKNEILRMLLNETSDVVNEVPTVISIFGMGGLGKTTLAQLAYNDDEVNRHFPVKMWVCVSDDFDVKRITKLMIESATKSPCNLEGLDPFQSCLRHEILHGKRFLLVLDDVWSNDSEKWDKLRVPFQAGAPGSRIIVTTRSEDVASTMGSSYIHKLLALSDEACWSLFNRRALEHRSAEERLELEAIGREIVKKCGGVPLAAKTIGSAMRLRRTRTEWEDVLGSEIWNSEGILPALWLSYQDLPPALKQCFVYCSVFPKDWEIEKDMIVKLWAAQGFIRSEEGGEIEKIGGRCFDDLLRRSLLQDAELDDYKNTVSCKMHDLVHDLAQFVSGSDCSTVEIRKKASLNLNNIRHSFLIFTDEAGEVASIPATLCKAQKLRTLLHDSRITGVPPQNLFHHLRYLRALDLSFTRIQKLSRTIGELKHLRYLDLSFTDIVELPEEVSDCRNLQTLRLRYCEKLEKLPRGMRKMNSLRHLEIEGTHRLKYLPQGIGRLTGLRTLTEFTVGGGDEGWNCRELKYLNHLQGSLRIKNVEKVRSRDEAREAELDKKQQLHALTLEYGNDGRLDDDDEDVLEILKPHTNLKVFTIWDYKGSKLPKWIQDPVFSNLVKVELMECEGCKQLPGLGKLPSLKYLNIYSLAEVRKVGGEFSGDANNDGSGGVVSFPKLETLFFFIMPYWEEWELREGDGQVMPSLVELSVKWCPKLKALPHNLPPLLQRLSLGISNDGMSSEAPLPIFPNLNHLEIYGNDGLTSLPGNWLGQLKALQTLEIYLCNRMESLPEELQHLTKLQQLKIRRCRVLEERYGDGGEDRDKIANIPSIIIVP